MISLGWLMISYGMWVYEHAYPLSMKDSSIHIYFYGGGQGLERTIITLGYMVMIVGSICYLLPFIWKMI